MPADRSVDIDCEYDFKLSELRKYNVDVFVENLHKNLFSKGM